MYLYINQMIGSKLIMVRLIILNLGATCEIWYRELQHDTTRQTDTKDNYVTSMESYQVNFLGFNCVDIRY